MHTKAVVRPRGRCVSIAHFRVATDHVHMKDHVDTEHGHVQLMSSQEKTPMQKVKVCDVDARDVYAH